jgi:hypothetical protein
MTTPTTAGKKNRTVPVEYAMCRTFMHAWDYTTVKKDGRHLIQGLVCLRCGTVRSFKIDSRTGEIKGNAYSYPENYLLDDGGGALSAKERAALRITEVRRHMQA